MRLEKFLIKKYIYIYIYICRSTQLSHIGLHICFENVLFCNFLSKIRLCLHHFDMLRDDASLAKFSVLNTPFFVVWIHTIYILI